MHAAWQCAIVFLAVAAYTLVLLFVPAAARPQMAPLSLVPVVVAAGAAGLLGGGIATLAMVLLGLVLFPAQVLQVVGVAGYAALVPTVAGVAWLRTLAIRARRQAAALAALAAEHERLRLALAARVAQREALLRATPELLAAQDERQLAELLATRLRQFMECRRGISVYLLDSPESSVSPAVLTAIYSGGSGAGDVPGAGLPQPEALARQAIDCGRPCLWAAASPETDEAPAVVRKAGDAGSGRPAPGAVEPDGGRLLAAMAIPLIGRNATIGAVLLTSSRPAPYTEDDADVALSFCNLAAPIIENLRLQRAAAEAQALRRINELKDELMRTVSHELRTPLSYVYGYGELLLLSDALPRRERQMAQEIFDAAEHMRGIVDQLLDLAQIESGQGIGEVEPTEIERCVRLAVDQVARAEGREHRITVDLPSHLPPVAANAQRVQQVLVKLLTNAARYSSQGSEILVTARSAGDRVEVAVADRGAGLSREQCHRIFEKFYRGDVALTGRHPGAGMGLALCRGLITAFGGTIWAESDGPGKGTTIRFTLPVAIGSLPDEASGALDAGSMLAAATVSATDSVLPSPPPPRYRVEWFALPAIWVRRRRRQWSQHSDRPTQTAVEESAI
jgi:signal transduction histidine kinase